MFIGVTRAFQDTAFPFWPQFVLKGHSAVLYPQEGVKTICSMNMWEIWQVVNCGAFVLERPVGTSGGIVDPWLSKALPAMACAVILYSHIGIPLATWWIPFGCGVVVCTQAECWWGFYKIIVKHLPIIRSKLPGALQSS